MHNPELNEDSKEDFSTEEFIAEISEIKEEIKKKIDELTNGAKFSLEIKNIINNKLGNNTLGVLGGAVSSIGGAVSNMLGQSVEKHSTETLDITQNKGITLRAELECLRNLCSILDSVNLSDIQSLGTIQKNIKLVDHELLKYCLEKMEDDIASSLKSYADIIAENICQLVFKQLCERITELQTDYKNAMESKNNFPEDLGYIASEIESCQKTFNNWKIIISSFLSENSEILVEIFREIINIIPLAELMDNSKTNDNMEIIINNLNRVIPQSDDPSFYSIGKKALEYVIYLNKEQEAIIDIITYTNLDSMIKSAATNDLSSMAYLFREFLARGPERDLVNAIIDLLANNEDIRNLLKNTAAEGNIHNISGKLVTRFIDENIKERFGGSDNIAIIIEDLLINLTEDLEGDNIDDSKKALLYLTNNEKITLDFCKSVIEIASKVRKIRESERLVKALALSSSSFFAKKFEIRRADALLNIFELFFVDTIPVIDNINIKNKTLKLFEELLNVDNPDYLHDIIYCLADVMNANESLRNTIKLSSNQFCNNLFHVLVSKIPENMNHSQLNKLIVILENLINNIDNNEEKGSIQNKIIEFIKPIFSENKAIFDIYRNVAPSPYNQYMGQSEIDEISKNISNIVTKDPNTLKTLLGLTRIQQTLPLKSNEEEVLKQIATPSIMHRIMKNVTPHATLLISEVDLIELYKETSSNEANADNIITKLKFKLILNKLKALLPSLLLTLMSFSMLYFSSNLTFANSLVTSLSMGILMSPLFLCVESIYTNKSPANIPQLNSISSSLLLISFFSLLVVFLNKVFMFNPFPYIVIASISSCCYLLNTIHKGNILKINRSSDTHIKSKSITQLTAPKNENRENFVLDSGTSSTYNAKHIDEHNQQLTGESYVVT